MANWNDPNMAASGFGAGANAMDQAVDAGLRSYMLSVYNYMGSGVLLTGIVAMLAFNSGFTASLIGSPLMWVVMLAPLAFRSEEHTSELQSLMRISYAVFCLKK